tara:strand:- start:7480 stop:7875 length:396 start_codon:yes stop_codon:yes gene_type:complete
MKTEIKIYKVFIIIILTILAITSNKLYNMESKYYKPLDSRLTIKPSNIDGLGLFATVDIEEGDTLGISHVYDERFKNKFIRTPLGGFINHSKEPNLEAVINGDYRYVKTIKPIESGEELTLLYNLYEFKEQ